MQLSIGQALGRGTRRSLSVSGIVLFASMLLYQFVFLGAINTVIINNLPPEVSPSELGTIGFAFPVSTAVAAVLSVVALLFGTGIFLIATRLLSRDLSEVGSVPLTLITHRFGWAFLSTLVVSLILVIVIPIGLVVFLIPGLFLAVSFQFAVFAIGVEDYGPLGALRRSWKLASGNRWRLFGLILLVAVVAGVSGSVGSVVSIVDPVAGQLVSIVVTSVMVIVSYGIVADAFVQLREGPAAESTTDVGTVAL